MKKKTVSVQMPVDLYERVVAFAHDDGRSVPSAIRQAVQRVLDSECVPAPQRGRKIIPFSMNA